MGDNGQTWFAAEQSGRQHASRRKLGRADGWLNGVELTLHHGSLQAVRSADRGRLGLQNPGFAW